ncbi:MAG TPA: DUF4405 domain-containing protein [Anaerolinea sp.]|nr:DUF4405 domain-containing protein [Anaerolinea sp.]
MKQSKRNFWLDVILGVTFIFTVFTGLALWLLLPHQASAVLLGLNRPTWLTAHVCSGLAGVAGSILHVIWHRAWLKALRKRKMASLSPKLRANRVTDRFVWITFLATSAFGALDYFIPVVENTVSVFGRLHVAFGMAWLLGITVHLVLHDQWIITSARRYLRLQKGNMEINQAAGVKD